MPAPYPLELRRRIVAAYRTEKVSVTALAKQFAVDPNTVKRYLALLRATGSLMPRPHRTGPKPRLGPQHLERLRALTEELPDATLAELAEVFAHRFHVEVSVTMIWRALARARLRTPRSSARNRA